MRTNVRNRPVTETATAEKTPGAATPKIAVNQGGISNSALADAMTTLNSHRVDLDEIMHQKLEERFGVPMTGMKVFRDEGLQDVGAHGYAKGNEIHIATEDYNIQSESGQELLFHEAGHVVQQGSGIARGDSLLYDTGLETQADAAFAAPESFSMPGSATGPVQGGLFDWVKKKLGFGKNKEPKPPKAPKAPKPPKKPKAPKLTKEDKIISQNTGDNPIGAEKLHKAHTKKTQSWLSGLTPEENEAVGIYTGGDYHAINKTLRGTGDAQEFREMKGTNPKLKTQEGVQNVSDKLSEALGKNRTTSDMQVFRGVKTDFVEFLFSQLANQQKDGSGGDFGKTNGKTSAFGMDRDAQKLMGLTFGDKGFSSTSIDKEVSQRFANMPKQGIMDPSDPQNLGHMLKINVPKGSKGAYVDPISTVKGEREFLLDKNSKFKVNSVTSDMGRLEIILDMLEDIEEGKEK